MQCTNNLSTKTDMKNLLFPKGFRVVGWLLFIPAVILGALCFFEICSFGGRITEMIINDSVIIGIALGSLFIVCSKEAHEDEMTRSIRLAALLNSLYIYVLLLITTTLTLNGFEFFRFMSINLVLLPIIYVVVFRLEMYSYNKMSDNEE